MIASTLHPIGGAADWRGETLLAKRDWIKPIDDAALREIDDALQAARSRDIAWHDLTLDTFPLPGFAAHLADIAEELETGRGVVKLAGLPVDRYADEDLRRILFGIGCHLGTPVHQNGSRGLMRDICDSGGKRVDSSGALRWHNDRTDVVGLLCVRKARAGGVSRIVSAVAIHDAMLQRRPDLANVLYQDYHRSTVGDEVGAGSPHYPLPVFAMRDGYFTSHFSRTYIEQAQQLPEVPRLTAEQLEALDLLMALAEELCFEMPLEPGDLQFLNNHLIYHGRTAFEDDAPGGRDRLLLRLWLSMPNSRPLPESHRVLWGSVEAGALRGGFGARP